MTYPLTTGFFPHIAAASGANTPKVDAAHARFAAQGARLADPRDPALTTARGWATTFARDKAARRHVADDAHVQAFAADYRRKLARYADRAGQLDGEAMTTFLEDQARAGDNALGMPAAAVQALEVGISRTGPTVAREQAQLNAWLGNRSGQAWLEAGGRHQLRGADMLDVDGREGGDTRRVMQARAAAEARETEVYARQLAGQPVAALRSRHTGPAVRRV